MKKKIPIIMCIDVEPDLRLVDRDARSPWKGYEATYELFCELRPRIVSATGSPAHFSWFFRLDPQVEEAYGLPEWPMINYPEYVEDFMKKGDELGLHPHAWRWDETRKAWIADFANQEWIDHCVRMSFESYQRVLKRDCDSFRFGDRWISRATLDTVEKLGARFDLTLEPGYEATSSLKKDELVTGSLPNYSNALRIPYRPSKEDFLTPAPSSDEGIWMIPVSTGKIEYQLGRLERLYRSVFQPSFSNPVNTTLHIGLNPKGFRIIVDQLLHSLEIPYLAIVLRSEALMDSRRSRNIWENFDYLLSPSFAKRFVFSTPAEAMTILGYLKCKEEVPQCAG